MHMVCTTSALIYYQSFTNCVHPICTSSALCVTLSSVSTVPYSRTGRTSPLYADSLTSCGHADKLRLRKPRVLLAFVRILLTCVFHFKSLVIVTLIPYSCVTNVRTLNIHFIIRIFNGCELRTDNSVTTVTVQHRKACRVMQNSYPE